MLKKLLFVVFLTVMFSAIAVSAKQLISGPGAILACGSPCNKTTDSCLKPCYCFISVEGSLNGVCQPEGPAQVRSGTSAASHTGF